MNHLIALRIKKLIYVIFSFNLTIYKLFLFHFSAPSLEHMKVLKSISNFNKVIDVGFNRGQFSSLVLKLNNKVSIISFDPLPSAAKIIKIFNLPKSQLNFNQICLSDKNKNSFFYITEKDDSSSNLEPIGHKVIKKINIKTFRFDSLNLPFEKEDVILLKVDVQGSELEVLKGFGALLSRINYIIIEATFIPIYKNQALYQEIDQFLNKSKFKLVFEYNKFFNNKSKYQSDLLYEKR